MSYERFTQLGRTKHPFNTGSKGERAHTHARTYALLAFAVGRRRQHATRTHVCACSPCLCVPLRALSACKCDFADDCGGDVDRAQYCKLFVILCVYVVCFAFILLTAITLIWDGGAMRRTLVWVHHRKNQIHRNWSKLYRRLGAGCLRQHFCQSVACHLGKMLSTNCELRHSMWKTTTTT